MQRVPKMLHWHLLHPSLKTTVGSRYKIKCLPFLCPWELHSNFLRDIFVLQTMMIWFVSKASDILTCAPMSRPTFWFLLHKLPQLSRTWREKSFQLLVYLSKFVIELLFSSPFRKSWSNLTPRWSDDISLSLYDTSLSFLWPLGTSSPILSALAGVAPVFLIIFLYI